MKKVIIYLGPSMPADLAKSVFPVADYRPPVCRGDLPSACEEKPSIIGIIDGALFQSLTASPKEILRAIAQGITVMGSSGTGALRAVELYRYGMVGIGTVFRWYQTELLQNDDAVAVLYDQKSYQRLSESLVNIMYTLSRALHDRVIKSHDKQVMLNIARKIYFTNRTYDRIFAEADGEIPSETINLLGHYIFGNKFDLQQK